VEELQNSGQHKEFDLVREYRELESRPLRFGTDLPLAELLRMLPQNSMTDFFLGLDPRLRFSATAKPPWDFPPELSLGFSVGKRW
jgi:hypothetical protein